MLSNCKWIWKTKKKPNDYQVIVIVCLGASFNALWMWTTHIKTTVRVRMTAFALFPTATRTMDPFAVNEHTKEKCIICTIHKLIGNKNKILIGVDPVHTTTSTVIKWKPGEEETCRKDKFEQQSTFMESFIRIIVLFSVQRAQKLRVERACERIEDKSNLQHIQKSLGTWHWLEIAIFLHILNLHFVFFHLCHRLAFVLSRTFDEIKSVSEQAGASACMNFSSFSSFRWKSFFFDRGRNIAKTRWTEKWATKCHEYKIRAKKAAEKRNEKKNCENHVYHDVIRIHDKRGFVCGGEGKPIKIHIFIFYTILFLKNGKKKVENPRTPTSKETALTIEEKNATNERKEMWKMWRHVWSRIQHSQRKMEQQTARTESRRLKTHEKKLNNLPTI